MATVYVLKQGAKARKERLRLVVEYSGEKLQSILLKDVDCVVIGKGSHISTPLIEELVTRKICVYFIDFYGKIIGCIVDNFTSWQRSKTQMECFMVLESQLELARYVLIEKLTQQNKLLKYYSRQKKDLEISALADDIKHILREIKKCNSIETLRGMEGLASKKYFQAFTLLFDDSEWSWSGRNRRPSQDPINALLNYGYAFLEREVRTAIAGAKLDSRFGFLHSNDGRKDSLVYDVMELFRQPIIDRLVLAELNRRQYEPVDFECDEIMGCRLTKNAKKIWISAYENYMNRVYQEYEGLTPREYIREKTKELARMIYAGKLVAA